MGRKLKAIENKMNQAIKQMEEARKELEEYKKEQKLPVPKIGGTIEIMGLKWIVLDKTENGYLCLAERLKDKMQFDSSCNDWKESNLREYLNTEFYEQLASEVGKENIITLERDLLSLDGQTEYGTCKDKVSLIKIMKRYPSAKIGDGITDDFGPVEKKINGPSVSVLVSKLRYNLGIAFGKLAELTGVLDIGFKTRFFGGILHMVLEDGTKADEVLTPNKYLVKSKYTYEGFPEAEVNAVLDVVGDDEVVKQTFSVISKTNPRVYERVYTNEDESWSSWTCLCGDFVIEQGVSGIWTYRKWNSGVAECWLRDSYSATMQNATGNMYYGNSFSIPMPITFTKVPTVSIHGQPTSGLGWLTGDSATNAGTIFIRPLSPTSANATFVVNIYAIGRWKE